MPVDIALGEHDVAPVDEAAQPRTSADLEGRVRAARALAAERVHAPSGMRRVRRPTRILSAMARTVRARSRSYQPPAGDRGRAIGLGGHSAVKLAYTHRYISEFGLGWIDHADRAPGDGVVPEQWDALAPELECLPVDADHDLESRQRNAQGRLEQAGVRQRPLLAGEPGVEYRLSSWVSWIARLSRSPGRRTRKW